MKILKWIAEQFQGNTHTMASSGLDESYPRCIDACEDESFVPDCGTKDHKWGVWHDEVATVILANGLEIKDACQQKRRCIKCNQVARRLI